MAVEVELTRRLFTVDEYHYRRELPSSQDVLLAVEVADTTVPFDRLSRRASTPARASRSSGSVLRWRVPSRCITILEPTVTPVWFS